MPPPKKFVPRQRKHKVRARLAENGGADKTTTSSGTADSNVAEITFADVQAHNEKKTRLREELRAGQATQMSAKKAKRLEKYIETKLRKDENRELYEKLAANKIDSSVFESSKTLGQNRRRRRGAEMRLQKNKKSRGSEDSESEDDEEEEEDKVVEAIGSRAGHNDGRATNNSSSQKIQTTLSVEKATNKTALENSTSTPLTSQTPVQAISQAAPKPAPLPVAPGLGLKRPLEFGEDGRPILPKRQKRGGVKSKFQVERVVEPKRGPQQLDEDDEEEKEEGEEEGSDEEWGGFSDSEEAAGAAAGEKSSGDRNGDGSGDSSSDDDDSDSDSSSDESSDDKPQFSVFKAWAEAQRNESLGFQPTTAATASTALAIPRPENFQPRPMEQDPLPVELQPTKNTDRKVFNVAVARTPEIDEARLALPIMAEEQQIMEAIHEHDVVIISGGTGSGKTTQVPQFLYEAGYGAPGSPTPGMIGVTEPRRVSAVSMARRVAQELGDHGRVVGYQIRFDKTTTKNTAVKFMTDGVLLREIGEDLLLARYSVIIVDEAHERSINTDVLLGILSLVNKMRQQEKDAGGQALNPLKLIIMSATLQIEELTGNKRLFAAQPRVINIDGRQYPVTVHFSKHTRGDYVEEAFRKICRGHRKLPPGSFLVFLTGEQEIRQLSRRLQEEINGTITAASDSVSLSAREAMLEAEDMDFGDSGKRGNGFDDADEEGNDEEDDDENDDDDDEKDEEFDIQDGDGETGSGPMRVNVLPLYSKLPTTEQQKVFRPPPPGHRQIILATNVAETGLTIPGIRYVFDCGRAKERKFNPAGVQSFQVGWISKASAAQRTGRAGRTGPGHCYRLYSSAVFEESFPPVSPPEILRTPVEAVVLQLKAFGVPSISRFPLPTSPNPQDLARAENMLRYIGALESRRAASASSSTAAAAAGPITAPGRLMSLFPLPPRLSKALLVSRPGQCTPYVISAVAALAAGEVFLSRESVVPPAATVSELDYRTAEDAQRDAERRRLAKNYADVHNLFTALDEKSDAIKLLQVVGGFSHKESKDWCREHLVRYKVLCEINQMRAQITALVRANADGFADLVYEPFLPLPSATQVTYIKAMLASGFIDQVAIRADKAPQLPAGASEQELYDVKRASRAINVPYVPLVPLALESGPGPAADAPRFVYIHPSSVLAHLTVSELPQYIVYTRLQKSSWVDSGTMGSLSADGLADAPVKKTKVRMHPLTDMDGVQLAALAKNSPLLSYGKPIKETALSADGYERECWVVPYLRAEAGVGGLGWPLPAVKVKQRKVPGRGWEVI